MDIEKLKVDDSQINKTTGRIILPEDDEPKRHAPRAVAHDPAHVARTVPHATPREVPAPRYVASPPDVKPAPSISPFLWLVLALVFFVIFALQSFWIMWSLSDVRATITALQSQVTLLQVELRSLSDAQGKTTQGISALQEQSLAAAREEQKQSLQIEGIHKKLDAFEVE